MLLAAVGAYAWDSSRSDEIAEGVTIGGVDVGGMTADEATRGGRAELVEPLRKQVTVTYDGVKYQLSPEKLEVDSDVDGMVDQALEESQEGGLPTRVWRYATGGEVDVAISPQITYSNKAIDEFIAKVAERGQPRAGQRDDRADRGLARRASPARTASRSTRTRCARRSSRRSSAPTAARSRCRSTTVEPEVTKDELAAQYPTYLTVNRSTFELTLWKDLEPVEDLHGRDRRRGLRHAGRRLQHPEQGGRPRLERARTPTGPATSPAPWSPAASPRTR